MAADPLFERLLAEAEAVPVQGTPRRCCARPSPGRRTPGSLVAEDVRHESLEVRFDDIAAVVVFLRKVIWTVPDFSVRRYRSRLAHLHGQIQRDGPFVSHSQRRWCRPASRLGAELSSPPEATRSAAPCSARPRRTG